MIRFCLFEPNRDFCLIPISEFRLRNEKSASVVEFGFLADFGAKPMLGNGNDINEPVGSDPHTFAELFLDPALDEFENPRKRPVNQCC